MVGYKIFFYMNLSLMVANDKSWLYLNTLRSASQTLMSESP